MTSFRERLRKRETLLGTFFKTPSPALCEVLGQSGLDMVCLDAEHSPFDRRDIDACLLAFRSVNLPCIVRPPSASPENILNALDCGASGVLIPHVITAKDAAAMVKAAHYGNGGRGFAGASRAGVYGHKSMADHLRDSAASTAVIVQIEDAAALENVDEIAAVDGVDGLFIGRMDLTVSLGYDSPDHPAVVEAVRKVCNTAAKRGRAVGMYTPFTSECGMWIKEGASFFLLGSEHSFMLAGAQALRNEFTAAKGGV